MVSSMSGTSDANRDRSGEVIAGYVLGEILGSGGFGSVYRAQRAGLENRAIKILHAELVHAPALRKRFEREIQTVRGLEHPNTVRIFESGQLADGSPYFIMELLAGEELSLRLERDGRLAHAEARNILEHVCQVLGVAHQRGIVHRDIKASNVFLCASGRIVLLDFGVAKLLEGSQEQLTMSRQVIGSACAMAPEQLRGQAVETRTDIYALGALAFHMLTGSVIFNADSAATMQHLHAHAARIKPSSLAPVPAELDRLVLKAMAIEARDRHPSAEDFARELRAVFGDSEGGIKGRADAIVVHLFFGACGDDAHKFAQLVTLQEETRALLQAGGFEELAERSRGGLYVLRLDRVPAAESHAQTTIARVSDLLGRDVYAGHQLVWSRANLQCVDNAILGGDALVPPSTPVPSAAGTNARIQR